VIATEVPARLQLPGGPLEYTLRRSPRSRGLRVVIHPERGVVVTVPAIHFHAPATSRRKLATTSRSTQGGINGWNLLRR